MPKKKQSPLAAATAKSWKRARALAKKNGKSVAECRSILAAERAKKFGSPTRKKPRRSTRRQKTSTRRKSQSQNVTTDFISALADTKTYVDSVGGFDNARDQISALETLTQTFK
jgi:hypothetical protein